MTSSGLNILRGFLLGEPKQVVMPHGLRWCEFRSPLSYLRHIGCTWTNSRILSKPHTFYISYASSAPVQAFADFWQFDVPILENMPANCSADVQAVISRVDSVLSGQSTDAINQLKDLFGLAALKNSDDFAHAREYLAPRLGLEGSSMDLIASYVRRGEMAGFAAEHRPKWRFFPVLRCFGGEGWTARSRFWMGSGSRSARLGSFL